MGISFLIVDDSLNIRAFIKKTLNMTDIDIKDIYEASNGEEAIEILKEKCVDFVLTDINMPKMDGLSMIKNIKCQEKFRDMKIIIISTEGSREKILEGVKMGASGYLKKPFGPEEIMELLQELM